MAILFSRDWTAANGSPWPGFVRVYGAAYDAEVQADAGWCGSTASERRYRATAFPLYPSHKAALDVTWKDAAGAGRIAGIGLRIDGEGNGYLFELDSNLGAARVRIRRVVNGTPSDVLAWTDVSGAPAFVSSARLNAGETLTARIENLDATKVGLRFYVGADLVADVEDSHATRIESGGSVAVLIGPNATGDDLVFDDLLVRDFEDERAGGATPIDEGVALVVDGTPYSWDELEAAAVHVDAARQSYTEDSVATIRTDEKIGGATGLLYAGATVTIALDGTVLAYGKVREAAENLSPGEGRTYDVLGPKALAADVPVVDPVFGGTSIRWNVEQDAEDYVLERDGKTIGEAIAYLFEAFLEGDGGLREQGAAPADGAAFTQAELDALDAELPEIATGGDFFSAVESLLAYTDRVSWVNPATRKWEFHVRNAGTIRTVDLAAEHVTGSARVTPGRNFTAVRVIGSRPEATATTLSNAVGGGLGKGWATGLEATHDAAKRWKNVDGGSVQTTGTSGGKLTLTPDPAGFAMDAEEWVRGVLEFTSGAESGNVYAIEDNTGSVFTLALGSWQAGGPSPGDTFTVRGNAGEGGLSNGHRLVGRRFALSDTSKRIADHLCGTAKITTANGIEVETGYTYRNEDDVASIELDLPAIGLVNFLGPAPDSAPEVCEEGGAIEVASVEVELPVFDVADPTVPSRRLPSSGFYGTAYTADSAKWSGGGKPGIGDPGIRREYLLALPAYDGTGGQDAEVDKLAADVLAVLSPLSREVRIEKGNDLDLDFAGLDSRLQVVRTGGATGPWSTLTDLGVVAVEWDLLERRTTVYAGTQASGRYDVQAMRRRFTAKSAGQRTRELEDLLRAMMECVAGAPKGSGKTGAVAPSQLCATQVSARGGRSVPSSGGSSTTPGGKSSNWWIDLFLLFFAFIVEGIFSKQKGITLDGFNEDGNPILNTPGGTVILTPDGPEDGDGNPLDPDDVLPANPDPGAAGGDAGMPGWYGQIWSVILALAGNLGKSITVTPDPTDPTGTPGGVTVGKPGAPAPDGDGTTYFPPCSNEGGGVAIPGGEAGGVIPGSAVTQDHAVKDSLGLEPVDLHDPGGEVWQDYNGDLYRPEPATAGSYLDGAAWERVELTPGVGRNGGDYSTHGTPKEFIPERAANVDDGAGNATTAQQVADHVGNVNAEHAVPGMAVAWDTTAGPIPGGFLAEPVLNGGVPLPAPFTWIRKL